MVHQYRQTRHHVHAGQLPGEKQDVWHVLHEGHRRRRPGSQLRHSLLGKLGAALIKRSQIGKGGQLGTLSEADP